MHKPVLQAMVLADHVYQDRVTGKFVIAGTFNRIFHISQKVDNAKMPADLVGQAGSPYLYLAITEVHSQVELQLRYVRLSDSATIFSGKILVKSDDPVGVIELCVHVPQLPIEPEGCYSMDLMHEDEILGSWRVVVVRQNLSADKSDANP